VPPSARSIRIPVTISVLVSFAIGAGLYLIGQEMIGIILAASGLLELALIPLLGSRAGGHEREVEREAAAGGSLDAASAEADPSYNPYARED
jgi:hypothetical protein